jgi:hypothetical protein
VPSSTVEYADEPGRPSLWQRFRDYNRRVFRDGRDRVYTVANGDYREAVRISRERDTAGQAIGLAIGVVAVGAAVYGLFKMNHHWHKGIDLWPFDKDPKPPRRTITKIINRNIPPAEHIPDWVTNVRGYERLRAADVPNATIHGIFEHPALARRFLSHPRNAHRMLAFYHNYLADHLHASRAQVVAAFNRGINRLYGH